MNFLILHEGEGGRASEKEVRNYKETRMEYLRRMRRTEKNLLTPEEILKNVKNKRNLVM